INGLELRLVQTRTGLKCVIQFAEGGPGELHVVNAFEDGKRLKFQISDASNDAGTFDGEITRKKIKGVFKYKSGATYDLILRRGISYWDR
ncbi:MAG: hypothetical protein KGI52_05780, partial [Burkholderiales bacterium]|nr:hypothetical protein [Burkholderiales bacterium]